MPNIGDKREITILEDRYSSWGSQLVDMSNGRQTISYISETMYGHPCQTDKIISGFRTQVWDGNNWVTEIK